jgi:hypothetical protein
LDELAPYLLLKDQMKMPRQRRRRLTDYLSEPRILVRVPSIPRVKVLLAMAQTMARDGSVRNPLDFYQELANLTSPWIAKEREQQDPRLKIYQVSSAKVGKLTAAMALCPEGVKLDEGETAKLLLLLATPPDSIAQYVALLGHVVCLFEPQLRREALLECADAAQVWALLGRLEETDPSFPVGRLNSGG